MYVMFIIVYLNAEIVTFKTEFSAQNNILNLCLFILNFKWLFSIRKKGFKFLNVFVLFSCKWGCIFTNHKPFSCSRCQVIPSVVPDMSYSAYQTYNEISYINPILLPTSWYLQGGPKKSLLCDLEEKCLRNLKKKMMESFSLYSHLLKKLELSNLFRVIEL